MSPQPPPLWKTSEDRTLKKDRYQNPSPTTNHNLILRERSLIVVEAQKRKAICDDNDGNDGDDGHDDHDDSLNTDPHSYRKKKGQKSVLNVDFT